MTIKMRPDGKFDVRVTGMINDQIHEIRRRGLLTKGEARSCEEQLRNDLFVLKQKGMVQSVMWSQALEEYYALVEKKRAYSTFLSTKTVLEKHTSCWKDRTLDSFQNAEIEKHIEGVLADAADASKKKLLQYIRGVFARQVVFGKITINPCAGLSYGKISEKKLIAMTRPEIERLLAEALKTNHPWYPIWRVMYELGLRSGEGLALKWTEIDFTDKTVTISQSYCSKSKIIGLTKNRRIRILPLNDSLAAFLKELKLKNVAGEFVLPQFQDWKRGEAAEILRTFQRDLGIRETNFHSLRASFITHLLLKNVAVTKVQEMAGHADLKTTQKYVRLVAADLKGATDALALDLSVQNDGNVIPFKKDS